VTHPRFSPINRYTYILYSHAQHSQQLLQVTSYGQHPGHHQTYTQSITYENPCHNRIVT